MALPAVLQNLTLPVVASPMFIGSYPELVLAQCKAGIVGSFPALNARPEHARFLASHIARHCQGWTQVEFGLRPTGAARGTSA